LSGKRRRKIWCVLVCLSKAREIRVSAQLSV
jgi:hypothetical protein